MVAFQLSQYELYSSRVKDFEVRGRQAHPRAQGGDYAKTFNTTGWPLLGKYTATKMKGSQVPTYSSFLYICSAVMHITMQAREGAGETGGGKGVYIWWMWCLLGSSRTDRGEHSLWLWA